MKFIFLNHGIFSVKVVSYIVLALTLTACAETSSFIQNYQGSRLAKSDVVELIIPYELEILEIDGKSFKTPYVPNGVYQIELLPGEHQFAVIYKEFWGSGLDSSLAKSDVFLFKQLMSSGERYLFQHDAPQELESANMDRLGSEVKVWLVQRNTGQKIIATDSAELTGFLSPPNSKKIKTNDPALESNYSNAGASAYQQLQHWWKMADDKQRQAFKDWVNKRSLEGKDFK